MYEFDLLRNDKILNLKINKAFKVFFLIHKTSKNQQSLIRHPLSHFRCVLKPRRKIHKELFELQK